MPCPLSGFPAKVQARHYNIASRNVTYMGGATWEKLQAPSEMGIVMAAAKIEQPLEFPSFDVDGTLGRLAKWLRILGFDAAYPRSSPIEGRYFVTAREITVRTGLVTVTAERPLEQIKEVMAKTGISVEADRLFTRCLVCNVPVVEVSREVVAGRVPEAILAGKSQFHECPGCRRIYWEGSHLERTKKRLDDMDIL